MLTLAYAIIPIQFKAFLTESSSRSNSELAIVQRVDVAIVVEVKRRVEGRIRRNLVQRLDDGPKSKLSMIASPLLSPNRRKNLSAGRERKSPPATPSPSPSKATPPLRTLEAMIVRSY